MSKPSLVIASNCSKLNEQMCNLLFQKNSYDILEVCTQGKLAEDALFMHKPDFAIISADYMKTSGITIARRMKDAGVQTKIALLTTMDDLNEMRLALEYGVRSYFNYKKDEQLLECLDALEHDDYYVDTELYHNHYFAEKG